LESAGAGDDQVPDVARVKAKSQIVGRGGYSIDLGRPAVIDLRVGRRVWDAVGPLGRLEPVTGLSVPDRLRGSYASQGEE
jgi:hypothetical protein